VEKGGEIIRFLRDKKCYRRGESSVQGVERLSIRGEY